MSESEKDKREEEPHKEVQEITGMVETREQALERMKEDSTKMIPNMDADQRGKCRVDAERRLASCIVQRQNFIDASTSRGREPNAGMLGDFDDNVEVQRFVLSTLQKYSEQG